MFPTRKKNLKKEGEIKSRELEKNFWRVKQREFLNKKQLRSGVEFELYFYHFSALVMGDLF